jgi:hypothetical protein
MRPMGRACIGIEIRRRNVIGVFRASQFYSSSAVHAITPTTEKVACCIGRRAPEPVSRWELLALPGLAHGDADALDVYEVDEEPP